MRYLYLVLLATISTVVFGQQNSPYSRFGLGQTLPKEQAHLRSMGYISAAYVDSVSTNIANPASLGAKELASFDVGFNVNRRAIKDASTKSSTTEGEINYLSYSFPVNKKRTWGMALGTQTLYSKKYDIKGEFVNDTYFTDFSGEGNTYKLFLQNGIDIAKNFRVGLDAGIFFGNLDDETYNNFLSTSANSSGQRTRQKIRGGVFNIGSQYTQEFNSGIDLTIGGTYQLETELNNTIKRDNFSFSIASFDRLENGLIDVLERNEFDNVETETNEDLTLPSSGSFGLFLRKPQKWSVGVDAKFGMWEDFNSTINNGASVQYRNSLDLALGGSFIPKYRNPRKAYEAFEYRYGGYYKQTALQVNGSEINDYGFTLGTSIPIKRNIPGQRIRQIPSSIDIGINVGQMGTIENNNIQDSYIKGTFGFNLNDIWFQKKKYD